MNYNDDPGKDLDVRTSPLLKNKVFLITAGAIVLLALAGGLYALILLNATSIAEPENEVTDLLEMTPEELELAEMAEVLPQQRRTDGNDEADSNEWPDPGRYMDPFAEPMRLKGVAVGGYGGTMAIIESGGTSYIVSAGDYIDDIWLVHRLTGDAVVLRAGNQEIYLYLHQAPVIEPVEDEAVESEPEDETAEED